MNRLPRTLSSIQVADEATWSGSPYLSIDIDWAHDEVLADTIDLIEGFNVPATWFVTHQTPLLERLRSNKNFELGIHPNFNFLLNGDIRVGKNAADVIERLLRIVPEAKSVRSHSITRSSAILEIFVKKGLMIESNYFIPAQSQMRLRPWVLWSGLVCVPYFWEDDVHILYESEGGGQQSLGRLVKMEGGLKVFDFHPIHVFLNTESLNRYERTRPLHRSPRDLLNYRYEGYGTRSRLLELLSFM